MSKSWERVTLETLLDRGWIVSHLDGNHGSDYPRKEEFVSEGVPYISANCLDDERVDMSRAKFLLPSRAALLRKGIAKDSDVLFAHNATVGPVAILRTDEEKVVLGTSLTYYRCNRTHILPQFLAHYMRSFGFKTQYLGVMGQSTRNQVPITKQREFYHVIPPLAEQVRIIRLLDEAFEGLATAKANAEKNLQNARALFESHLQSVFTQRGNGWEQKRMVELCSIITCGVASTPKYVDETVGVPFLSAQNVKDGEVLLKKYRFISRGFHEKLTKKNKPQVGDILYSRVGAKFGEAAVVEHDFEFSVYVSLTLIRPIATKLDNYFLKLYLNSPSIKLLAKKSISSSGVPNLNVKDVREFPISFPSIEKQRRIVSEITTLQEETQRLARIYERKLAALAELKKSLLHKAFTGEL